MEIKQLEYFVMTADQGSLNRAAEQLYTSQPNVSKVISGLEKELGVTLFERSNKGISLTSQGIMLYGHAKTILKNSNIIMSMVQNNTEYKFSVSGYQSSMLTRLMAEAYMERKVNQMKFEYREGSVEEITDNVSGRLSEIGIIYIAKKQLASFNHIMDHKKLDFYPLAKRGICIYMGKNHPLYDAESIDFFHLEKLKFVQGTKDFFDMEHHLDQINVGSGQMENLDNIFYTNSDYMIQNLLLNTDICCMGIDFVDDQYKKYDIRAVEVTNCEKFLTLGYVKLKKGLLSTEAKWLIKRLKKQLSES